MSSNNGIDDDDESLLLAFSNYESMTNNPSTTDLKNSVETGDFPKSPTVIEKTKSSHDPLVKKRIDFNKQNNDLLQEDILEFHELRLSDRSVSLLDISNSLLGVTVYNISDLARVPQNVLNDGGKGNVSWVCVGVLSTKSTPKTSSSGKPFMTWNITDYVSNVCIFVFDNAYEKHRNDNVGDVFLITCPVFLPSNQKGNFSLSVSHEHQVTRLGRSPDFGICRAKKKDGTQCTMVVNRSKLSYCRYHLNDAMKVAMSDNAVVGLGAIGRVVAPVLRSNISKGKYSGDTARFIHSAPSAEDIAVNSQPAPGLNRALPGPSSTRKGEFNSISSTSAGKKDMRWAVTADEDGYGYSGSSDSVRVASFQRETSRDFSLKREFNPSIVVSTDTTVEVQATSLPARGSLTAPKSVPSGFGSSTSAVAAKKSSVAKSDVGKSTGTVASISIDPLAARKVKERMERFRAAGAPLAAAFAEEEKQKLQLDQDYRTRVLEAISTAPRGSVGVRMQAAILAGTTGLGPTMVGDSVVLSTPTGSVSEEKGAGEQKASTFKMAGVLSSSPSVGASRLLHVTPSKPIVDEESLRAEAARLQELKQQELRKQNELKLKRKQESGNKRPAESPQDPLAVLNGARRRPTLSSSKASSLHSPSYEYLLDELLPHTATDPSKATASITAPLLPVLGVDQHDAPTQVDVSSGSAVASLFARTNPEKSRLQLLNSNPKSTATPATLKRSIHSSASSTKNPAAESGHGLMIDLSGSESDTDTDSELDIEDTGVSEKHIQFSTSMQTSSVKSSPPDSKSSRYSLEKQQKYSSVEPVVPQSAPSVTMAGILNGEVFRRPLPLQADHHVQLGAQVRPADYVESLVSGSTDQLIPAVRAEMTGAEVQRFLAASGGSPSQTGSFSSVVVKDRSHLQPRPVTTNSSQIEKLTFPDPLATASTTVAVKPSSGAYDELLNGLLGPSVTSLPVKSGDPPHLLEKKAKNTSISARNSNALVKQIPGTVSTAALLPSSAPSPASAGATAKSSKLRSEVEGLLGAREERLEALGREAQFEAVLAHLDARARVEAVQLAMHEVTEADIPGWNCKTCKRWGQRYPRMCAAEGHPVVKESRRRYGFLCSRCGLHVLHDSPILLRPCEKCGNVATTMNGSVAKNGGTGWIKASVYRNAHKDVKVNADFATGSGTTSKSALGSLNFSSGNNAPLPFDDDDD